jgi:hypothetical protein
VEFPTWADGAEITPERMNESIRDPLAFLTGPPAARVIADTVPQTAAGGVRRITFLPPGDARSFHSYDTTGGTATALRDRLIVTVDGLYDVHVGAEVAPAATGAVTYADAALVKNSTSSALMLSAPLVRFPLLERAATAWRNTASVRLPFTAGDWITLHVIASGVPWQISSDWSRTMTFVQLTWVGDLPAA